MGRIEHLRLYLGNNQFIWWFIYGGDRLAITAGLLAAAFIIYFTLGSLDIIFPPGNRLIQLLSSLASGLLSLLTLVLTVNQLVLSEQFGSMGELYDRLEQMINFRERIKETSELDVMPVQPGEFIAVLLTALSDRAQELKEDASEYDDNQLSDEIDQFATDLTEQMNQLNEEINNSGGTISVILIIIDYSSSRHFYTARRLQTEYADIHSDATKIRLGKIQELFKQFTTTRQYFKKVYLQRELSQLSRMTVYTGIIAVLSSSIMVLSNKSVMSARIDPMFYHILLSGALVAIQSPLAVLFSYGVRAATISRKTAAFGPFIPEEEQEQVSDQGES